MRKLASIQTIQALEPIPEADVIERAKVLGWWVVVKKGDFKVGDLVVYGEIDSLMPERPEFEFLRKSCYRNPFLTSEGEVLQRAGFRIRTVQMRGQISQGICFPVEALRTLLPSTLEVGQDVTESLGIIKYDPPLPSCLSGRVKSYFPSWIPKTDETRVQVLEEVIVRHKGKRFYLTEKLDGSSCTIFAHKEEAGVCGRTLWYDETDETNSLCKFARENDLFSKMRALSAQTNEWYAVQGEFIGPGIQGNLYALKKAGLYIFDILVVDPAGYYVRHNRDRVLALAAELGLPTVPQLDPIVLDHTVDQLVELSIGKSQLNPNVQREGVVLRPEEEQTDPQMGRLSFKVINPKFLLKYEG